MDFRKALIEKRPTSILNGGSAIAALNCTPKLNPVSYWQIEQKEQKRYRSEPKFQKWNIKAAHFCKHFVDISDTIDLKASSD